MIFPIWQPLFSSSHRLAAGIGAELGEPATHTGTLDPLAEGVLVILTGEDRWAKEHLGDWDKEYEFEILWGVSTDSGDLLGKIHHIQLPDQEVFLAKLDEVTHQFLPEYEQRLPDFSARRWQGKSAFEFAREEQLIPVKKRMVKLHEIEIIAHEQKSLSEILALQHEKVAQVEGDFRQEEIVQEWRERLGSLKREDLSQLRISKLRVVSSSGFYVRQFIQDVAKKLAVPALAYSIVRTRNGPFGREDC